VLAAEGDASTRRQARRDLAALALADEREELGIAAGLQAHAEVTAALREIGCGTAPTGASGGAAKPGA
jgi:hypothetical protein